MLIQTEEQIKNEIMEARAEEYYEEAVELLKQLAVIPAFPHFEEQRAVFIRDWIMSLGVSDRDDVKVWIDDKQNVVCRIEGKQTAEGRQTADIDPEEITIFCAHTDTVFELSVPRELSEQNGRLLCPGIGDDTANLINMLIGLKYILTSGKKPEKTLLFVADACEEGLGNCDGIRHIFETTKGNINEFYTFDLYLGQCVSGAVGSYRYKISVDAEGGHSYLDFGRPNPIIILAKIIEQLSEIKLPDNGKVTFNFGTISGGTSVNTIPEHAEVLYEFRSESQECLEYMEQKFLKVMSAYTETAEQDFKVTFESIGIRPGSAWQTDQDEELKIWSEQKIKKVQNWFDGDIDRSACSTDANIPLSMKKPAIMIGTVAGGGAHTLGEWIELESMRTGMKIVMDILSDYIE